MSYEGEAPIVVKNRSYLASSFLCRLLLFLLLLFRLSHAISGLSFVLLIILIIELKHHKSARDSNKGKIFQASDLDKVHSVHNSTATEGQESIKRNYNTRV